ncbi:MAG TPA: VWA domain-containing protein [Pyrinomonadaceae bacterium]|nr:VWA domain-containing protein [Pyrinomonadaceae bacterium]
MCAAITFAQDTKKSTPPIISAETEQDDVVRINTDLIQTGVAVFDKKGQFVNNLKLEDFQLTVDGKPVSISFFEESGAGRSRAVEAKGKQNSSTAETIVNNPPPLSTRGRNIIFVVDDLHLNAENHARVKKLISKFIDQEMRFGDTAAVVSSTGRIGFLQQFTDDKIVLRAAVAKLNFTRERSANDPRPPPMSEYEALLISQWDKQVTDIFTAYELGGDPESKIEAVRSRARTVLSNAAAINRGTYSTLEQAIRSSSQLPGRKTVFFISDGFLLDPSNSDSSHRMRRIIDAAARTNAVIYSIDAKGLDAGFPEGTTGASLVGFRVQSGERFERQDGLNLVAIETGGRFIKNTNDLQTGLTKAIDEANQFYLLAWQPVSEDGKSEKLRKIEVKLKGRPELRVRVQKGYFDKTFLAELDEKKRPGNKKAKEPQVPVSKTDVELDAAANALVSTRSLPVTLTANYLDVLNEGILVYVASEISSEALEFSTDKGGKPQANIDILGLVYDSNGKRAGFFRDLLTVDASQSALSKLEGRDVYHNYQIKLKPGLYQIRVAARDAKNGNIGSAVRWIEIPNLSSRKLTLSSLILNERVSDVQNKRENIGAGIGENLRVIVDPRISRTSHLRYMIFAYNAARGAAGTGNPDVTVQTQILRGNDVLLSTTPSTISTTGQDVARLPYAAEISLANLPAGRYDLQVVVRDRIAKSSSTQRVGFEVK